MMRSPSRYAETVRRRRLERRTSTSASGAWTHRNADHPARREPVVTGSTTRVRPRQQPVLRPGVDDAVGVDAGGVRALAPYCRKSSCPGACASLSIENRQPSVAGELEQLGRRVASFGTRVDLDGDVVLDAGLEDGLRVEARTAVGCRGCPSPSGRCSGRARSCAGSRIAPIIRLVIGAPSMRSLLCTLATRTSSRASISSVWSSAAVVEDVDLDPLEQREPCPPRWSLIASTTPSWRVSRSTLRPLATVRRGEWSVSTWYS